MQKELIKEKIMQAKSILIEKDIDLWLIFVRESSYTKDPVMDTVVGANVTWQSAFLIHKSEPTTAIVGSIDAPNMKLVGTFDEVIGYVQSVKEPLTAYLNRVKPNKIAINFSKQNVQADGLTYGMYLSLLDILEVTDLKETLVSSEEIISILRGRKSSTELNIMKEAVTETLKIYDEVSDYLRVGQTEKEVAAFILRKVDARGFGLAWDRESCPSVFTGPDTAGAHSGPTDRVIEKGHILNMDFGVKLNGYCSDLQRTWYVLGEGETEAPEDVKKGFRVLLEAIEKAALEVKPGMLGWQIDNIARSHIVANGYEEFQHALGHQVGRSAHDGGVGFYPKWERYGNLPYQPIEVGQVFTIEPRLFVPGKGVVTIEEEIVVTENGCEYLSAPQKHLYIVKS